MGPGNYCSRNGSGFNAPKNSDSWESDDAEVAAWDANDNWYDFEFDQVKGRQTADQVAAFINLIANKSKSEL